MKKIVALAAFFLWAGSAWAAPFVVSDPYPASAVQPDGFAVSVDGGAVVETPPESVAPGSVRFRFDVGGVSTGAHTMRIKAFKNDAAYGRVESAEAVFTFTRPAAPAVPGGFQLVP